MIEGIKNIIELFLDKSKHWTLRAGVFISIIGVLFILDFTLDLSYNYYVSRKLENLEKIQILKKNYSTDSLKLNKILFLEEKIMNKKHYSEFLFPDFSFPDFSVNSLNKSNTSKIKDQNPTKIVTPKIITNKPNIRSYFWMLLTSNYLFVLVFVVLLFVPLSGKEQRTLKSISAWFASLISSSLMIIFITWIAFKIPLIYNEPIYNYILNFLIHTVFIIIIVKLNKKNKN
jgi:hypothetical protein